MGKKWKNLWRKLWGNLESTVDKIIEDNPRSVFVITELVFDEYPDGTKFIYQKRVTTMGDSNLIHTFDLAYKNGELDDKSVEGFQVFVRAFDTNHPKQSDEEE